MRPWQVIVGLAGLAMGVGGFAFWLNGARSPGLDGTWTGSATHPSAGRVFPMEMRMAAGGESGLRWGADLHCSGRLEPTRSAFVYTLTEVRGEACHPGTVRLFPSDDPNRLAIKVTRQGKDVVTYSGTVSRTS